MFKILLVLMFVISVRSDYSCLCNYNKIRVVYLQPFDQSQVLGQLMNGDCKPRYQIGISSNWAAIQYQKQVGFITVDADIRGYTCHGYPPKADALTVPRTTPSTIISGMIKTATTAPPRKSATPVKTTTLETKTTTTTTTARTTTTTITTTGMRTVNYKTSTRSLQCPHQVPRSQFLKEFGQKCYEFIIGEYKKWSDAEHDCKTKGGHLVTIGSQAEQDFIYEKLQDLHYHGDVGVWIGFTDKYHEGRWTWSSGETARFMYWAPDQPGLFGSFEDCALMVMSENGHWDDFTCSGLLFSTQKHGYVCEYRKM